MTKKLEAETVDMMFKVVAADEARDWIAKRTEGRFGGLKQAVVTQLRTLRKSEALQIPVPSDDKKECTAITTACNAAIKRAGLDWKLRYSQLKKCVIAIHSSRFDNGKDK